MRYIGRFAPSPSGPLHLGSLVAALGSYLQARCQNGLWKVRIEDLDPPREMQGAAELILRSLEAHALTWDGEIIYQSQRHALYQAQIDEWLAHHQAYYCTCSRQQIQQSGGLYLGHCRGRTTRPTQAAAIRLRMQTPTFSFQDQIHGLINIPHTLAQEDFIIKRRDGLFAYNLAVVLDDIAQGITQIVRGADLIEPTGRQISLYHLLAKTPPSYLHLPLVLDTQGNKLSKQNHAPAIDNKQAAANLCQALHFLGLTPPIELAQSSPQAVVSWGCQHWDPIRLNRQNKTID